MKNTQYLQGGGDTTSLSKKYFNPLISTSLAITLSLGFIEARTSSSLTCSNTQGLPSICFGDGVDISTGNEKGHLDITWNPSTTTTNNNTYQIKNSNFINGDFSFWLEDASASEKKVQIVENPNISGSYMAQIYGEDTLIFSNASKTIKMGDNGDKTLGIGGGDNTTVILDFANLAHQTNYALLGNLFLGAWSNGIVQGEFGGKGISGTLHLKNGNNQLLFKDTAHIAGDTTISGGVNVFGNVDHKVFNKSMTITGGQTHILTKDMQGKKINEIFETINLRSGSLTFGFDPNDSADKLFALQPNNLAISGGLLVFDDIKTISFDNTGTGDGILTISPQTLNQTTYQNGGVKFLLNPSAPTLQSSPILQGDINATRARIIFALNDLSTKTGSNPFDSDTTNDTPPLDSYYINGNIMMSESRIWAFWNDEKGFYGKLALSPSHSITISQGLIGQNKAWFAPNSFSSHNTINTIQILTQEATHLVFEDKISLSNKNSHALLANKGKLYVLFGGGVDISGDITQENGGVGQYIFERESVIKGSIQALNNNWNNEGSNTLIFGAGGEVVGDISIQATKTGRSGWGRNKLVFEGEKNATIKGNITANDGGKDNAQNGNIIIFAGSATNTIQGSITATLSTWNDIGQNSISFTNPIGNAIIHAPILAQNGGKNQITIKGASTSIEGNISSNVDKKGIKNSTLNDLFIQSQNASIAGNITSNDGGKDNGNIIFFAGTGQNSITGNISSSPSSLAGGGQGHNKITFASPTSTNTIQGEISSSGGKNEFFLAGDSTITGNMNISNIGSNIIHLIQNVSTLTLSGKATGNTTHQITSLSSSGANSRLVLDNSTASG